MQTLRRACLRQHLGLQTGASLVHFACCLLAVRWECCPRLFTHKALLRLPMQMLCKSGRLCIHKLLLTAAPVMCCLSCGATTACCMPMRNRLPRSALLLQRLPQSLHRLLTAAILPPMPLAMPPPTPPLLACAGLMPMQRCRPSCKARGGCLSWRAGRVCKLHTTRRGKRWICKRRLNG